MPQKKKTQPANVYVVKIGDRLRKRAHLVFAEHDIVVTKFIEAIHLAQNGEQAFLFPSGVVVDWSADQSLAQKCMQLGESIVQNPHQNTVDDYYPFQWSSGKIEIDNDVLSVPRKNVKALALVSYALAQSIQLDYKESRLEVIFHRVQKISQQMSEKGKVRMRGKRLRKLIGEIVALQHDMAVYGGFNEQPELLWEEPKLAQYYSVTAAYFELSERFEAVAQKMEFVQSTLDLLRDEFNHKHSSILEWIIIVLIAFEFVFFIIHG